MIPRYSLPEMAAIWEPENKFKIWLKVEVLACEALAKKGEIPKSALKDIQTKSRFNVERIDEIEREVKHDVIAFLTCVAEHVGESARYMHMGMTSSDVLDTALAVQMKQSATLILKELKALKDVLEKQAKKHKLTPTIGRSHGIHAEPLTFGLKIANWYEEINRNIDRLKRARQTIAYGQISGAVGTFACIDPDVEEYVCAKLGLKPAPVSSQVIQRDRHAEFFSTLAIIAGTIDKIATEIRHLQRTEVQEAEEFFSKGQKGSSAMPHKRNPVVSEQMSGLARVVRANALAAMENMPLWHERDISHSSVERVIGPDSTILIHYMLKKMTSMMDGLMVYPENMMRNLKQTGGLIFSQSVLLALVRKGITREEAYSLVQKNAMQSWTTGKDFLTLLKKDKDIKKLLSIAEIDKTFQLKTQFRNIDRIFKRVFKK
ncbi:MAG: adenylosuccinate lyase [Nitrospina sp.]|nr:adenylosuccinate lyase [Nitrospina sp.]MBT3413554.1 adenylosuccinate lyase [Nitrospina sp.]MBT3855518.1 adenylosuccinate lyase [Nitrospina sp.]MBT4104896.1 adenylosuccinate lyase [Nitrospina sp.]MBT4388647.1 adenylosuccinate lyase [Nitrospina sp.]